MDRIARMDSRKRRELFVQTAARFPYLSEAAVEKDFWGLLDVEATFRFFTEGYCYI